MRDFVMSRRRSPSTDRGRRLRSGSLARGLVAALALLTVVGCKPLDDAMVAVFGRSMRDQRSFDPHENPRPDPENSVAFATGNWPGAFGEVNVGQPESVRIPYFSQFDLGVPGIGGPVVQRLENPIPRDDAEALARGEELYMRYCVVCHGPEGVGANAYIIDFHPLLTTFNLSGEQVAGYSDAYIYAVIRVGRGLMPSYGARITHFDRWAVVNYVRQLQQQAGTLSAQAAAPAPDEAPPPDDAPQPDDAPPPDDAPQPDDAPDADGEDR